MNHQLIGHMGLRYEGVLLMEVRMYVDEHGNDVELQPNELLMLKALVELRNKLYE